LKWGPLIPEKEYGGVADLFSNAWSLLTVLDSTRAVKRWHGCRTVAHDSSSQVGSQTVLTPELTALYASGLCFLTIHLAPALKHLR